MGGSIEGSFRTRPAFERFLESSNSERVTNYITFADTKSYISSAVLYLHLRCSCFLSKVVRQGWEAMREQIKVDLEPDV